nr:hypothetical protein [Tanacetum cinerariifolium]
SLHSTKYSSPALTQKVFANMRRVGKGFYGVDTPLFEGMLVAQQVDESAAEVNVDDVPAAGVADEGAANVNADAVVTDADEPSIPSTTPLLNHHHHHKINLPLHKYNLLHLNHLKLNYHHFNNNHNLHKMLNSQWTFSIICWTHVNDVTRLQALVDKKKVIIIEATIRDALPLVDAEGIDCLPNKEIFSKLSRMRYEKPSTKLTFYNLFFSPQWKFLFHTILQCMSAKRTSWNDFSSS